MTTNNVAPGLYDYYLNVNNKAGIQDGLVAKKDVDGTQPLYFDTKKIVAIFQTGIQRDKGAVYFLLLVQDSLKDIANVY